MEILTHPNPLLRQKSIPYEIGDAKNLEDKDILLKLNELAALMYQRDGAGIAAPQVGWHVSLFAIVLPGDDSIVINPDIIKRSIMTDTKREGCLSVPGKTGLVVRNSEITAVCKTISIRDIFRKLPKKGGLPMTQRVLQLSGKEARCFQHEYDHLHGVLYIDRAVRIDNVS